MTDQRTLKQRLRDAVELNVGERVRENLCAEALDHIENLEKLVYVPGQWRCPKCEFRLTQSNLYAESGTVGPRDEPGDKCPNCNGPLWRVSAMDDRNEAFKCANDTFDRVAAFREALTTIASFGNANLASEWEHGLRDIIRAMTDCAKRALAEAAHG